jgi:hypothetical protein
VSNDDNLVETGAELEFFLSYHHDDKILAGKVQHEIKRRGSEAFLAHEDIPVSKTWRNEILSHLRSCNALIAIVTASFPSSDYAGQEVGMVMGKGKPVVSLVFGGTLPGFLESLQAIPTSEPNVGIAVQRAIRDITSRDIATYIEPAFKTAEEAEEIAINELKRHIRRTVKEPERMYLRFKPEHFAMSLTKLNEEKGAFDLSGKNSSTAQYDTETKYWHWSMVIDARTGRIISKSINEVHPANF